MDWCKYNDCVIATGSVDKSIKIWDVRVPDREVTLLAGHSYAVRRCSSKLGECREYHDLSMS